MIKTSVLFSIIITTTALAQRIPAPATMPAQSVYDRPSPAELMQLNGGSLLRASLASAPDPAKAHIASISFFSVPEPEPTQPVAPSVTVTAARSRPRAPAPA